MQGYQLIINALGFGAIAPESGCTHLVHILGGNIGGDMVTPKDILDFSKAQE